MKEIVDVKIYYTRQWPKETQNTWISKWKLNSWLSEFKVVLSAKVLCAYVFWPDTNAACMKGIFSILPLNFQPIFKIINKTVISYCWLHLVCQSPCLSVRIQQILSQWVDFLEILYLWIFRNLCRKFTCVKVWKEWLLL